MIWKITFTIFALMCCSDAIIAFSTFTHFGDFHMSWGGDALIAAGTFLYFGWQK